MGVERCRCVAFQKVAMGGLFVVEQVAPRVDPTVLYLIAVPISDIEYRAESRVWQLSGNIMIKT